jgi:hypothetical protein
VARGLTLKQVTQAERPASHDWGWKFDGKRFWPPLYDGDMAKLHLALDEFEASHPGRPLLSPPAYGWSHGPDCDGECCRDSGKTEAGRMGGRGLVAWSP